MKDKRILIDTSVWIDYFRGRDKHLCERVDDILSFSEIFVPKVVIAELIQGAVSEREITVIGEFIEAFNVIDQKKDTWSKAGRLSFSMKRKGISVNLIDCYIAELANENSCMIFSLDTHFKDIKKFLRLELI